MGKSFLWIAIAMTLLTASCAPVATSATPTTLRPATQTLTQTLPPSATSTPTRKPTETPLPPVVFTSSRYNYSITLPAGWKMEEVPGTWDGTTASPAGEPRTDAFYKSNPREFVPLEIGFLPVKAGTTVEEWQKEESARPQE